MDIADCVWRSRRGRPVAIPLGVWDLSVSGRTPWTNHIEFVWQINGAMPPGVTFDIKRVKGDATCERTSPGGPWAQVEAEPAGTPDDSDNGDECLSPQPPGQRIFSNDGPGFATPDPVNTILFLGGSLSSSAVAARTRLTFEEWVEASGPGVGSNVTISPRVPWHATISIDKTTTTSGPATWRRTPGEPNDVGLGAISLNCAGGAAAPARPPRTAPRQPAAQTPRPRGR